MTWEIYQKLYRNSVLQLIVISDIYDPFRPYLLPKDITSEGSGFFIDYNKGLILTNAHVIENAVSIIGRIPKLGKNNFNINLIKTCPDKDIALLKIFDEDLKEIKSELGDVPSFPFGDHFALNQTDEVMAIGFPLGYDRIKFTIGYISGYQSNVEEDEDSESTPSYIEISVPINPGSSGSPLINTKGELVGINAAGITDAQNVSYSIGSRTILGILPAMMKELDNPSLKELKLIPKGGGHDVVLKLPKISLDWCNTNKTLLTILSSSSEGIYVEEVHSNSCLKVLKESDIISGIQTDVSYLNKSDFMDGKIDNYGDVTLKNLERHLSLKEFIDVIPINSKIQLLVCRDKNMYSTEIIYSYDPNSIQPNFTRILHFQPLEYMIIGGMCITPLTLNHIELDNRLKRYGKNRKLYKNHLLVVQIFPNSEAFRVKSIKSGDILRKLNGYKVHTLEDIRSIIKSLSKDNNNIFEFANKNGDLLCIFKDQMIKEDMETIKNLEINYTYSFT